MRSSGVLLPVFSLPSEYGIGCFSKAAYAFIDQLYMARQSYWQILPLGPASEDNSPYDPMSSFAGNPIYIDLVTLVQQHLLKESEISPARVRSTDEAYGRHIDYSRIKKIRISLLKLASSRFVADEPYLEFCEQNRYWLEDTALFYALSENFGTADWRKWPRDIRDREPAALIYYTNYLTDDYQYFKWTQYEFFRQWKDILSYAHKRGIRIIGDMPIYTSRDGADVWAHRELFQLDEDGYPTAVSGCPPDAFARDGQKWDNPLYRWNDKKDELFRWWSVRISKNFEMFDILRIDHFRGLQGYFSIPPMDENALNGHWEPGPGIELFRYLDMTIGKHEYFAEDLGVITDDVRGLLSQTGYPGMKVLQFAFDSDETNPYLPHNYSENCVVYTGTHDNDTLKGWYRSLVDYKVRFVDWYLTTNLPEETEYFRNRDGIGRNPVDPESPYCSDNICEAMIDLAYASKAEICIIPMQDYMSLDSEARINVPSVTKGNWTWQMPSALTNEMSLRIARLVQKYDRI